MPFKGLPYIYILSLSWTIKLSYGHPSGAHPALCLRSLYDSLSFCYCCYCYWYSSFLPPSFFKHYFLSSSSPSLHWSSVHITLGVSAIQQFCGQAAHFAVQTLFERRARVPFSPHTLVKLTWNYYAANYASRRVYKIVAARQSRKLFTLILPTAKKVNFIPSVFTYIVGIGI